MWFDNDVGLCRYKGSAEPAIRTGSQFPMADPVIVSTDTDHIGRHCATLSIESHAI